MTTVNPLKDSVAIRRYFEDFDRVTAARGRMYFRDGAVLTLACSEPGVRYSAVVRGGREYEVTLSYEAGDWDGECSCPVEYECKHLYATMLAFQQHADRFHSVPAAASGTNHPAPSGKHSTQPAAPQPPLLEVSPVVARVTESLGRQPNAKECDYLRKVQALFQKVSQYKVSLMPYDLQLLAPGLNDSGWNVLELWPTPPRDDYELWLYCAWELQRRGLSLPDFMRGATDFSPIEADMKEWHRGKEVARWRGLLAQARQHLSADTVVTPLDLRLMLTPARTVVQGRTSAE